jgi:hypothetical protein
MTFARRKRWNAIKKRRKISHAKLLEQRAHERSEKGEKKK